MISIVVVDRPCAKLQRQCLKVAQWAFERKVEWSYRCLVSEGLLNQPPCQRDLTMLRGC